MWLKLILLCIYLLLLFVLSRLLEVSLWYNGTNSFLNSRSLLDPFSLSVKKLKQLLDNRGVCYTGVVEKKELIELVKVTGSAAEDELLDVEESSKTSTPPPTHFTCGSHFYEEVEDTKDSIWLVQVSTETGSTLLDNDTWSDVVEKVHKFGVRTGVFHCSMDKRLCARKGWNTPRLILALPRGYKAKEDVELHHYIHASKLPSILNWVRLHLTSRIKQLDSNGDVTNWIKRAKKKSSSRVQMLIFSELKMPPLFLSSLAIKFIGRVDFAMVHVTQQRKERFKKYFHDAELPVYLVITSEKNFYYGTKVGENPTFKDMDMFLKALRPEVNDIFLWTLFMVNCTAGFELFLVYRRVWKHLIRCFIIFFNYNCFFLLSWLFLLTLYQFTFMNVITELALKYTRVVNGTNLAAIMRYDWKQYCSWYFMTIVYFLFGSLAGFIVKKYGRVPTEEETAVFSSSWDIPWSSFIMSYFFRPIATRSVSAANQDLVLEDGIDLLIERLAVPNLWLQPIISMDYIKDLPVWKYQGWCDNDDLSNDNKVDVSSDDESAAISSKPIDQPNLEQCQSCHSDTEICDSLQLRVPNFNKNFKEVSSQKDPGAKCQYVSKGPVFGPRENPSKKLCWCDRRSKSCPCLVSLLDNPKLCSPSFTKQKVEVPSAGRAPWGMLESRECSICLESYQYGEVLCGLPCGHNYHGSCIMLWLHRDNHCCPICRWPSYKSKSRPNHSRSSLLVPQC